MATISGYFSVPAVTGSVACSVGAPVTVTLKGEFARAIINTEISQDAGATWKSLWTDFGIRGASNASDNGTGPPPPRAPGTFTVYPPGAGLFRLNCTEFRSGWCSWSISS